MNKEIDAIANRLKNYCDNKHRYDEELFNLGVELGRQLERNNIKSYRPTVFVEFEDKNNAYELLSNEFNRIESVIEFLIHTAIKKHIDAHGDFEFSKGFTCTKFDSDIVEKFCIQLTRVTQQEYGGHFEAEFELSGDVLDLLKECSIAEYVRCDVENTSGDEHETIYRTENISNIVFGIGLHINRHSGNWDLGKLKVLAEKLEQKQTWLSLQGI